MEVPYSTTIKLLEILLIYIIYGFKTNYSQDIKPPNVLLIVIDDLRPALGIYGDKNAYTPNIDKLAQNSFVFRNAFCQQALCAPSRNSFLTSRRPDSLHLYDFYSYWRDSVGNYTTLPEHFRNNKYFTHSIGKVFHPGISSNFTDDSEYSWSDDPYHPPTEIYKDAKVCAAPDGSLARNLICPVIIKQQPGETLPDLESLNAALDFIRHADEITDFLPYFLAVGFHKPHVPLKYPLEYLDYHPRSQIVLPKARWKPSLLPNVAWNPWTDIRERDDINLLNVSFPYGPMPDNMTLNIIQSYSAAVTYVDDIIGTLLKEVQDDTIVVLVGDHGWSLGEHGEFSKFSNYDIATRVPLIIRVPNVRLGTIIIDELVELVDLFPTLVDLTNVSPYIETCEIDKCNSILCTEGRSLVPLMTKKLSDILEKRTFFSRNSNIEIPPILSKRDFAGFQEKTAVFSQYPRPGTYPTAKPNSDKPRLKNINIMGYSIRSKTRRYTEWVKFDHTTFKPNWNVVYGRELYDHTIDPDENLNLATRSELNDLMLDLRRQLILGWRYA